MQFNPTVKQFYPARWYINYEIDLRTDYVINRSLSVSW